MKQFKATILFLPILLPMAQLSQTEKNNVKDLSQYIKQVCTDNRFNFICDADLEFRKEDWNQYGQLNMSGIMYNKSKIINKLSSTFTT